MVNILYSSTAKLSGTHHASYPNVRLKKQMNYKILLFVTIIGVFGVMGLFSFKKAQQSESVIYRLVWFELQIAPSSYRFAIIPEQPILIGGDYDKKGATMLIRYEHVPEVYERTVERLDIIVRKSGILNLQLSNPDQSFEDSAMENPSIHIRIAYADNTRWVSTYDLNNIPEAVSILIQDTKSLAKEIMQEQSKQKIDGDTASKYVEPGQNTTQQESPSIIVKVKVYQSGKISANNQMVTLSELNVILDNLKEKNGEVWYFRESPSEEPSEALDKTITQVLDAITSRELSVHLQSEEY